MPKDKECTTLFFGSSLRKTSDENSLCPPAGRVQGSALSQMAPVLMHPAGSPSSMQEGAGCFLEVPMQFSHAAGEA